MTREEFWQLYECDRLRTLDGRGQSSVYAGRRLDNDQWVAIKVAELHQNFDKKGEWGERYELAQALNHPNLLKYWDVHRWQEGDWVHYSVVMPLVDGRSLDTHKPSEDWRDDQRKDCWLQVAEALQYLHERGATHQQLCASHVLVNQTNDFYLPLLIQYGSQSRVPLAFIKNYEYLAPEQFDEQATVTAQADIWALGVLGYWLWTGQLPFGQKSTQVPNKIIQQRILRDEIPSLLYQIPQPYQTIIERCLQKEPTQRWASVAELLAFAQMEENEALPPIREIKTEPTEAELAAIPLWQRSFKRKPSEPISIWKVLLLIAVAALLGHWLNTLG